MTLPTKERMVSGDDTSWKSTTHRILRAIDRFVRAGGRQTEGHAAHLLEAIAVLVFDPDTGIVDASVPPVGSGLRWEEFIDAIAKTYRARFEEVS
jgi:hypothetical protein